MKNLLRISLVLITLLALSFAYTDQASAQGCVVTGATPDGGEVVNCSGTDTDGITTTNQGDEVTVEEDADISRTGDNVIDTLEGDDVVRVNGGRIEGLGPTDVCVKMGEGNNEFHMTAGTLIGQEEGIDIIGLGRSKITIEGGTIDVTDGNEEAIDGATGPDEVYIMGGLIIGADAAIMTRQGNDIIIITGGRIVQTDSSDQTVDGGSDDDLISVSNAVVDGTLAQNNEAINGDSGDDTVKLGTGAVILGKSSGGEDFDTLVFEMEVREEQIDSICSQILSLDPNAGSITINGLFYEWIEFEVIKCEIKPVVGKPIPTLSQWGLIAMVGLIGIAGVLFAVRRRITV